MLAVEVCHLVPARACGHCTAAVRVSGPCDSRPVVALLRSVASVLVASMELAPDHTAAARARQFVAVTLRAWGLDEAVEDAELLVSELVTNAILHARSPATVRIDHTPPRLRVAVCDSSPSPPRVRDYGPDAVTGRGMLLVDRIARRWGVEMNGNGKCVWFEVDAAGQDRVTAGG
jgi:anti-sigma regulatory factor (Ser/Thr protein kinase)